MRVDPGLGGSKVEMSLAPALERCGNANGYVFDQNFMLVKADVTTKRLARSKPPRRPGTRTGGIRAVIEMWNR